MTTITKDLTVRQKTNEILKAHGLDYIVDKVPTIISYKNTLIDTGYCTLVNAKTKEVLNQVKPGYTVSQNYDIIEQVVKASESFKNLTVVKAGSLNGGRKIYVQLLIEGDGFVGQDTVKRYVTLIDSNDGSTALGIGIGDFTMSCKNQFYYFYSLSDSKYRHSSSITDKISLMHYQIEYALSKSMRMMDLYKTFQSTKVTKELANDLVRTLMNGEDENSDLKGKAKSNMQNLYDNIDIEIADKGMNLWGLHSGITRWTTHVKQAPKRANGRQESIIVGTNYNFNEKSFKFALEHIGETF